MHWRGHSATMQQLAHYDDVVADVRAELRARVDAAVAAGVDAVARWCSTRASASPRPPSTTGRCCTRCRASSRWACRCWSASSRKSFLGTLLADADGKPRPVDEREDATTALTAYCALQGVWGVRVHEVRPSVDAALAIAAVDCRG